MSIHDGFLDLAATAIDFDLEEYDRAELDRHLAGCADCRRTAAAFRDEADAIAAGARPRLATARSVAILADLLRTPKRAPVPRPSRLPVVAVAVVLAAGLGVAIVGYLGRSPDPANTARSSQGPSSDSSSSGEPGVRPSQRPGLTALSPSGAARAIEPPATGALPVRASARTIGTRIRMAPATGDDLYVAIPASADSVLVALVSSSGHPQLGWPIVLERVTSCEQLLPVADGSVRLLCALDSGGGNGSGIVRAFAFDSRGDPLPGWPIDLDRYGADGYFAARISGDELTVLAWKALGDHVAAGSPAGNAWIMAVAADGTVGVGSKVAYGVDCCIDTWAIGTDGVAYGTLHHFADTSAGARSELVAIAATGVPPGFPIAIVGSASRPAIDAAGLIHLTVGTPNARPAGTLAFDAAGRTVDISSGQLEIAATGDFLGAGASGDVPVAPLVGADGRTFVIDLSGGKTTVAGVSASGGPIAGWPYQSDEGPQLTGGCGGGGVCEGSTWAAPAIGPDDVLYLLNAPTRSSTGGSVVAVGQDGGVVAGWPVGLKRAGSELWSVVTAATGSAHTLAIEPEPNGSHSATILSLAADSSVRYTLTIVEP